MAYKEIRGQRTMQPTQPELKELEQADQLPGDRILAYRKAAKLSQRALAETCDPPMDFTAIGRIEHNKGYTSSTLNRLANALNCEVADFFIPNELILWRHLNDADKQHIADTIRRFWQSSQQENQKTG